MWAILHIFEVIIIAYRFTHLTSKHYVVAFPGKYVENKFIRKFLESFFHHYDYLTQHTTESAVVVGLTNNFSYFTWDHSKLAINVMLPSYLHQHPYLKKPQVYHNRFIRVISYQSHKCREQAFCTPSSITPCRATVKVQILFLKTIFL